MHAIILAGGKGTRLRPFTMSIPKPLLPLGEVPVIEVVISQLASAGFRKITLALNHMAPVFRASLEAGKRWDVEIEYVLEDEPLGTAGALRLVPNLPERFLVMNGDLLTTFPYKAFYRASADADSWASLAVHKREVHIDYGVIEYGSSGSLLAYKEKPTLPYSVSMGINILTRRALELMPKKGKFDMPALMLAVKKARKKVTCFPTDCYWQDIGRFDDYQKASDDFVKEPERFLPKPKK